MTQQQPSWWIGAVQDGFSAACIEKFGLNFTMSDHFIVRSDFISTKPTTPHRTYPVSPADGAEARRRGARAQQVRHGAQLSERAMQRGSLLGGR